MRTVMTSSEGLADLSVLHIGAGRHDPLDSNHSTFDIWRELAKGFRKYTVVCRSNQASYSRIELGNLTVCFLPSKFESEAEFLVLQALAVSIGAEVRADVVVSQCPVRGGLAGTVLGRKIGSKLLSEMHGYEYFSDAKFGGSHWAIQKMTGYPLKHSCRIRALSEGMKSRIISRYGDELESKIVCLPPRVDVEKFSQFKRCWSIKATPKLIIVGSVNERKGQVSLVTTLLNSNLDFVIWIVGDGPDVPRVRKIANDLGGSERVKFFGQITHSKLAQLLPLADVMIQFSNNEGTPRAIMEGMVVGLPIITSNAGFCSDVVENETQGFVLGAEPTSEIVERLDILLGDENLRSRMGQAGRKRAVEEFNANSVFDRYRTLIRETAAG